MSIWHSFAMIEPIPDDTSRAPCRDSYRFGGESSRLCPGQFVIHPAPGGELCQHAVRPDDQRGVGGLLAPCASGGRKGLG
jgi:hypothetical protein